MKQIIFSVLILLTVTGCATRLPEDELARSRERLERYLMNDAMTQSEINILSQNMVELANMEAINSEFINDQIPQAERLMKLNRIAISQMRILSEVSGRKLLAEPEEQEK